MKVNEMFYSIQGESTYAGWPCAFVRLTGCNLRCGYCDTPYAYQEGQERTIEQIMVQVKQLHDPKRCAGRSQSANAEPRCSQTETKELKSRAPLVEITGGEPMLQEGVHALMSALLLEGYRVLLETNGSLDLSGVDERVIRIIDVKCPGSGMSENVCWPNLALARESDEFKFVLSDRRDYQWAKAVLSDYQLSTRCTVLLSTVFEELAPREVVQWILEDHLAVRFQLQMHKMIWSPDRRGV
ncbi:MAG: 7-carboxy-7-deazaguanine synthase [Candidatus Latescibacterota bacterium]